MRKSVKPESGVVVVVVHRRLAHEPALTEWFPPREGFVLAYDESITAWEISAHAYLPAVVLADEEALLAAEILRVNPGVMHPRVLILGDGPSTPQSIKQFLLAGAMGYVDEKSTPTVLRKAIRCLVKGEYWASRQILSHIVTDLLRGKSQPEFTQREMGLIQLLAQGRSNREIAENLGISLETVRWHLRRIYPKLGVSERLQATRIAASLTSPDRPYPRAQRAIEPQN